MATITLVDTSVLCELLQVPGKSSTARGTRLLADLNRRWEAGERLVIPLTAIIETGNHIAQSEGDRYTLAGRLVRLLRSAGEDGSPWHVLDLRLGKDFLHSLCAGASSGEDLAQLAARKVGAGDVAVLVERDQLKRGSAVREVKVWTLDHGLDALAKAAR